MHNPGSGHKPCPCQALGFSTTCNLALLVPKLASYSAMGSGPTSNEHVNYVKYVIVHYVLLVATRKPCPNQALSHQTLNPCASRAMCKPFSSELRQA
jgi:hypothetical protein